MNAVVDAELAPGEWERLIQQVPGRVNENGQTMRWRRSKVLLAQAVEWDSFNLRLIRKGRTRATRLNSGTVADLVDEVGPVSVRVWVDGRCIGYLFVRKVSTFNEDGAATGTAPLITLH